MNPPSKRSEWQAFAISWSQLGTAQRVLAAMFAMALLATIAVTALRKRELAERRRAGAEAEEERQHRLALSARQERQHRADLEREATEAQQRADAERDRRQGEVIARMTPNERIRAAQEQMAAGCPAPPAPAPQLTLALRYLLDLPREAFDSRRARALEVEIYQCAQARNVVLDTLLWNRARR